MTPTDAQSKTLVPLLILRYLEQNSDQEHPVTREQIEKHLELYGISMERKAFFRHMENLNQLEDVDIRRVTVKDKNDERKNCAGFYIGERTFTEMELRTIIDSLSGSRFLSEWETEDLVERLAGLSSRHFQKKMAAYQFIGSGHKTDNETLMLNLELIDEAISQKKRIQFDLLGINKDGEKEIVGWAKERCSPVRYFVKEQTYYLVAIIGLEEKQHIVSYDLSSVVNVEVLDKPAVDIQSIPGYEKGVDWKQFLREHPSLENLRGKAELCTFHCHRWMLDEIKTHFGDELRVKQFVPKEKPPVVGSVFGAANARLLEVSVITDPYAAMMFAWQHPESVWLIAPYRANQNLRHRLERQMRYYTYLEETMGAGVPEKVFQDRQERDVNRSVASIKNKKDRET